MKPNRIIIVIASLLFTTTLARASSSDVADFYKDKTVVVISPSGSGGSIYQYALIVSHHLGRHIPGSPTTIIQARRGAGGVTAANYVSEVGPKDGTVVAELHPNSLLAPLTTKKAKYDPRTFHWLGSLAVRTYVGAVWHTVKANSLEDMKDRNYTFGGSGVASASYQYPTFLAHLTGAHLRVVPGYKSGGETNLAMERGEIQGRGNYYQGFLTTNPEWVRDKKVKFIFKLGPDHPDLANVPSGRKYAKTPKEQQMLHFLEAPLGVGQAFYIAEEVPPERVAALRQAFKDMLSDPEFIADAKKAKLYISPTSTADIEAVVSKVYQTPKGILPELEAILKPKH